MKQNEQALVTLLHDRECPYDYQCVDTDCIECVKKRMEKGATDGKE